VGKLWFVGYQHNFSEPFDRNYTGVDFTNIFTPSFCTHGAQNYKKTDDLTVHFTLLGSTRVKAVRRTLMKLSPGRSRYLSSHTFAYSWLNIWYQNLLFEVLFHCQKCVPEEFKHIGLHKSFDSWVLFKAMRSRFSSVRFSSVWFSNQNHRFGFLSVRSRNLNNRFGLLSVRFELMLKINSRVPKLAQICLDIEEIP